eukprot:3902602-Alexandrium_andersonii.AAC.1
MLEELEETASRLGTTEDALELPRVLGLAEGGLERLRPLASGGGGGGGGSGAARLRGVIAPEPHLRTLGCSTDLDAVRATASGQLQPAPGATVAGAGGG